MRYKLPIVIILIVLAVGSLVYAAMQETSQKAVTVSELIDGASSKRNVRLGARVAEAEFQYQTQPSFLLSFVVRDITAKTDQTIPVIYRGIMPDTLKVGRDVILEGDFDGKQFEAKYLLTQCPSKYEPATPGND